ncbi:MAG: DUF2975 domain-containing protein [Methanocorpusculum sp.]|nr:DUF2975 domain-containing protein [Methanocorpusculum sp.]
MNATETKIDKSAKTAGIVLTVAEVLCIILMATLIIITGAFGVIFTAAGDLGFSETVGSDDVIADFTSLTPDGTEYSASTLMAILASAVVSAEIYLGLILAILIISNRFFEETRKALTPFITENAKRIRIIAGLVLIASVVPTFIDWIGSAILMLPLDFSTISIEGIIIAVIIYCIGILFEHGCELQKEADETL